MRLPRLRCLAASACVAGFLHGESFEDRVESLFRPPNGEMVALSPDGQRIAYTTHRGADIPLVIASIEPPGPKKTVKVEPDRDAGAAERPPAQLRFLRWASNSRLVFAPAERIVPLPPIMNAQGQVTPNPDGPTIISPIMVVDAEGKERGAVVDARDFQETSADARRTMADLLRKPKELAVANHEPVRWRMPHLDVLGFLPRDREQLILGTRGAYSKPGRHLIDLRTGSVTEFGLDWPGPPGEPQIYDWFRLKVVGEHEEAARPTTTWRDTELARVQQELGRKFPRRVVEILDWSDTRTRVLFRVTGGNDPGRVFVFQRAEDLALEVFQRAPWLDAGKLNPTRAFEFPAPDGARLSGYLSWPAKPRLNPPPLLVVFPSGFPGRAQPPFDPEAQVFADLGFAVARLNHRSVAGVRPEDVAALRAAVDRVSVDDARTVLDALAAQDPGRPYDRQRVAVLGRGFGGYLALRALQLFPAAFHGGIAIDAPVELRAWLRGGDATSSASRREIPATLIDLQRVDWEKLSVLDQADALTRPVLLWVESARGGEIERDTEELAARLKTLGRLPEYIGTEPAFAAARPASRGAMYQRMEAFLHRSLDPSGSRMGLTTQGP